MYGRVLSSVVLPFFLIAAGFGYALEVRQRHDVEDHANHVRQAAALHPSPAVVVVQRSRGKLPVARPPRADELDYPLVLLDSQQVNDYTAGGGIGGLMDAVADPTRQNTPDGWVDSVVAVKPTDFIAIENDINLLLVNTTELQSCHRNLYLPTAPAQPSSTAVPWGADGVNAVPEPATGLLLAIGACAIIRKRRRRP